MLTSVIIGAGLMGRHHASAAERAGAAVVSVVDRDVAAADRLSGRLRRSSSSASLTEALDLYSPDVVHICTPAETHLPLAIEAAAAGAHALVEKPLARSTEETERVVGSFDRARRIVSPVHQYAFQVPVEQALARLRQMGPIHRIEFDIRSAGGGTDRNLWDQCVADILPHPLSIIQRLLPSRDIDQLDWRLLRAGPGEWLCTSASDSTILSIGLSLASRPTCFNSRILCDRGTIEINHFHGYSIELQGAATRMYKIAEPLHRSSLHLAACSWNLARRALSREWAYPGLNELVAAFYSAAGRGDQSSAPVSSSQALAVARVRDRMLAQSAE